MCSMKILNRNITITHWWYIIFYFTLLVYAVGIPVTIMEPDAASYADVAMEMVKRNNFLEIYLRGNDWLDKPHFQFWITALSYKIFGINNFGYKFPAVLFSLLAVFYTYLFGKRFYSVKHGAIASIVLMTAQHFILSNNDVRAEPYLAALTIFALYYFARYLKDKKFWMLILGSFGLACLLMTKGLFTILPVISAVGLSLISEKKWSEIANAQWALVILITLVFTLPSLIGYYIQFDLHPEKVIFGRTHVSGIKFFFWDSQWGRFTNTGPIKGEGDIFFYVHTMLWSFAPWAFLVIYGSYIKILDLIRNRGQEEKLTLFGFIFVFAVFSISKFQLPHYLNQLFPLMAIIATTGLLASNKYRYALKIFFILQIITIVLFGLLTTVLHIFYFSQILRVDVLLILIVVWSITLYLFIREPSMLKKILIAPALFILSVNYYLNRQFYPHLLTYQSESEVAYYMKDKGYPVEKLIFYEENEWITDFYLKTVIPEYNRQNLNNVQLAGKYVFTSDTGLQELKEKNYQIDVLETFYDFHVTTLSGEFINKKTRSETLHKNWLVRIR